MKTSFDGTIVKKLIIAAASVLTVVVIGVTALAATTGEKVEATTVTYHYDAATETWLKDIVSVPVVSDNVDGPPPKASNTIIIRLRPGDPVKQIIVVDGLIIGGTEPILEIAGHDTGGSGELHIGTLLFKKVDAKELEFHDTDAVRISLENVVAQDNELDMDVDIVNVVRTGRGAASSLFIGATRSVIKDFLLESGIPDIDSIPDNFITTRETGIRVDRIRILGPAFGEASVERIIFFHSSVFGKIEVKDVEIQDLILRDVTLDDSSP